VSGKRVESKMIIWLFGMSESEKKVKRKNDVFFLSIREGKVFVWAPHPICSFHASNLWIQRTERILKFVLSFLEVSFPIPFNRSKQHLKDGNELFATLV